MIAIAMDCRGAKVRLPSHGLQSLFMT